MWTREVSKKAARAFLTGRKFTTANTKVWHEDNHSFMKLFDNLIAIKGIDGKIRMSFCGWFSKTTKDRLQAIINESGKNASFFQEKNIVYLSELGCTTMLGTAKRTETIRYVCGIEVKQRRTAQSNDNGFFTVA